jgi:hypothetical protein
VNNTIDTYKLNAATEEPDPFDLELLPGAVNNFDFLPTLPDYCQAADDTVPPVSC